MYEISYSEAQKGEYIWVDIREHEELKHSSLKGIPYIHLPLSTFDEADLEQGRSYLFFCRSGRRSLDLVTWLRNQGWENVYSLKGGLLDLKYTQND